MRKFGRNVVSKKPPKCNVNMVEMIVPSAACTTECQVATRPSSSYMTQPVYRYSV